MFLKEANNTAKALEYAMDIAIISFSFPLRTVMVQIYTSRTQRHYNIVNFNTFIDWAIFMGVLTWYSRFQHNLSRGNEYGEKLNEDQLMIMHIVNDINSGAFRFDFLLALTVGFFWLKVLFLLRLTRTFGPLIKIIFAMVE